MQKCFSDYIKQSGKNCPLSFRKKLTADLSNSIYEYLEENQSATLEDITDRFGSPEQFADEYILAMDETSRKNALHKAKWNKCCILIGVAAVVLILAITAVWIIHENSQTAGYYYSIEMKNKAV